MRDILEVTSSKYVKLLLNCIPYIHKHSNKMCACAKVDCYCIYMYVCLANCDKVMVFVFYHYTQVVPIILGPYSRNQANVFKCEYHGNINLVKIPTNLVDLPSRYEITVRIFSLYT